MPEATRPVRGGVGRASPKTPVLSHFSHCCPAPCPEPYLPAQYQGRLRPIDTTPYHPQPGQYAPHSRIQKLVSLILNNCRGSACAHCSLWWHCFPQQALSIFEAKACVYCTCTTGHRWFPPLMPRVQLTLTPGLRTFGALCLATLSFLTSLYPNPSSCMSQLRCHLHWGGPG